MIPQLIVKERSFEIEYDGNVVITIQAGPEISNEDIDSWRLRELRTFYWQPDNSDSIFRWDEETQSFVDYNQVRE